MAREWSHGWILTGHRSSDEPDLEAQAFELEFIVGSREGFGGHYDLDLTLGPLNSQTVRHEGVPKVEVRKHEDTKVETTPEDRRNAVTDVLLVSPWIYTRTEVAHKMPGNYTENTLAFTYLEMAQPSLIASKTVEYRDSAGKRRTKLVWGMSHTEDLDGSSLNALTSENTEDPRSSLETPLKVTEDPIEDPSRDLTCRILGVPAPEPPPSIAEALEPRPRMHVPRVPRSKSHRIR